MTDQCADDAPIVERPKLSDGGHEARRLQTERDAAVRCSAWLNEAAARGASPRVEIGEGWH